MILILFSSQLSHISMQISRNRKKTQLCLENFRSTDIQSVSGVGGDAKNALDFAVFSGVRGRRVTWMKVAVRHENWEKELYQLHWEERSETHLCDVRAQFCSTNVRKKARQLNFTSEVMKDFERLRKTAKDCAKDLRTSEEKASPRFHNPPDDKKSVASIRKASAVLWKKLFPGSANILSWKNHEETRNNGRWVGGTDTPAR